MPLLPDNLGFDEQFVKVGRVLDNMGGAVAREVTVDEIKNRFFTLGLQTGFALQMFVMSTVMMATAYDHSGGAIFELSRVYCDAPPAPPARTTGSNLLLDTACASCSNHRLEPTT